MTLRQQIMLKEELADLIMLPDLLESIADLAEAREAELLAEIQKYKLKALEAQGMADCMDMVMQELERAGIISAHIPPMFAPEAILSYIHKNVIK